MPPMKAPSSPVKEDSSSDDDSANVSDTSVGKLKMLSTIKEPTRKISPLEEDFERIMVKGAKEHKKLAYNPYEPKLADFVRGKFLGKGKFG